MMLGIRVIPNARQTRFSGTRNGEILLRVAAPATGGRANEAVIRCLARTFGVPKSSVRIVSGERSRHKKIEILGAKGDAATVAGLLSSSDG